VHADDAIVKIDMSSTINNGEIVKSTCKVLYKDERPLDACSKTKIRSNADSCSINVLTRKDWLISGCKSDFTVLCSKSNILIDVLCFLSDNYGKKKINGKLWLSINKICSYSIILFKCVYKGRQSKSNK